MGTGIYAITNTTNGKVYIGSTVDFKKRWYEHRWELQKGGHSNPHLQSSWNKHGENAFEFVVLEYLDNLDDLVKVEQFWLDKYREEGKELYNFGLAAGSPRRGCKHTEEARCRMSKAANKRPPTSRETKYKISEAMVDNQNALGSKRSEDAKRKTGDANRGRSLSEEHKCKISESNKGRKHTKETKCKISETQKGNQYSLGCKRSEETKQKMSRAQKARWARSRSLGLERGKLC